MKKVQRLFMIIPKDIHLGVIESQMLGLAKLYTKKYDVCIVIPDSIDLTKLTTEIKLITYSNNYDLRKIIKKSGIVYFRSVINFVQLFIFCKINKLEILYDFRGFVAFESFYKKRNYINFIILFFTEFLAYVFANKVQCVSENMKQELEKKFLFKKKIDIIPCLAHQSSLRTDHCKRKIRFVYVGGIAKWQMLDLILEISLQIQKEILCEFTFISNNPSVLENRIKDIGLLNFKILSGDNNFVQTILKQQDFGFLLRENLLFNRISSPIKFLEYTSNGVVPIITQYVGDYSNDIEKYKLGIVFKGNISKLIDDLKSVSNEIVEFRQRNYRYSSKLLWKTYCNI